VVVVCGLRDLLKTLLLASSVCVKAEVQIRELKKQCVGFMSHSRFACMHM